MPRAISQTSPQRPRSFTGLAAIELDKQLLGGGEKIVVSWQVRRRQGYTTGKHREDFGAFLLRKCVELLDQSSRTLGHATSVPRC
jgi:hypothetical protein